MKWKWDEEEKEGRKKLNYVCLLSYHNQNTCVHVWGSKNLNKKKFWCATIEQAIILWNGLKKEYRKWEATKKHIRSEWEQ